MNCTFTNKLEGGGHLTLKVDAVPDAESHFIFRVNGPNALGGIALQDDGDPNDGAFNGPQHTVDVVAGTYNVSLRRAEGDDLWQQQSATCSDGSPIAAVQISSGENVTCMFVYQGHGRVIAFETIHTGGSCGSQVFGYSFGGPGVPDTAFELTCFQGRSFDVTPGTGYSLTIGPPPSQWELDGASCDDGSPLSNITVGVRETVRCTIRHGPWPAGDRVARHPARLAAAVRLHSGWRTDADELHAVGSGQLLSVPPQSQSCPAGVGLFGEPGRPAGLEPCIRDLR